MVICNCECLHIVTSNTENLSNRLNPRYHRASVPTLVPSVRLNVLPWQHLGLIIAARDSNTLIIERVDLQNSIAKRGIRVSAWESRIRFIVCPCRFFFFFSFCFFFFFFFSSSSSFFYLHFFLLLCPMGTNLPKGSLLARTVQYIAICSGRYKAICLSVSRNRTRTLEPRRESLVGWSWPLFLGCIWTQAADTTLRYLAKRDPHGFRSLFSRNR